MSKIYEDMTYLIGKTPLVYLNKIKKETDSHANLIGKVELFNPSGSIKARAAMQMLVDAEEKGIISKGATIIEPTSGNTGIALAMICAIKGYKAIFTMPSSMSVERQKLLRAYGAEVVLTDAGTGMNGAIQKAYELNDEIENSYVPGQFDNDSNPYSHVLTTGPEIWEDTDGKVDILVAGVGTGGTITGIGHYLKNKNPNIEVIAVEPFESPVLSGGEKGPHKIEGIGAGFVPKVLKTNIYDEVIRVKAEEAFDMTRKLASMEGILAGISSGAALFAAVELAKRPENQGKNIVIILPDTGERYLSTPLFE